MSWYRLTITVGVRQAMAISHSTKHRKLRPGTASLATRAVQALSTTQPCGRSVEEQLARAARLQRLLLPDISMPVGEFHLASLYCPCETLGGDFCDLRWRADCAVLLVADVMGHGVEAALITMLAKAAFVETAGETGEPRALVAGMRARLNRLMPERAYVAAAVARLPFEGPDIELASAGLPHPFVLRAAARRVEAVPLDGVPMGLYLDQDPDPTMTAVVRLEPGDVLLIASDGVGSLEGRNGTLVQDQELFHALQGLAGCGGRDVLDGLTASAAGFGRRRRVPDDINLVSVCRPGPRGRGGESRSTLPQG